ncbi:MAG: fatty acid--CoA ligase family protein [Bacteroidota bacterium]
MDKIFFVDPLTSSTYSYERLFDDLRGAKDYLPIVYSGDYYEIFRHIILSILLGKAIQILDYDFTESELDALLGKGRQVDERLPIQSKLEVRAADELKMSILTSKNWHISLFTSGTTGIPKKVTHSIGTITRATRVGDAHRDDVWGFAYNPTHIAGLQVFFQAILNGNPMIRLFGLSRERVLEEIERHGITNISATPTFYRLLIPIEKGALGVKRVTSGGEKIDSSLRASLGKAFPNAKFLNVYASTEAGTVFASEDEFFTIDEPLKESIKIENNELFIRSSLMGGSEQIAVGSTWYATGDIVELISENPLKIRFLSRKVEIINVGGYKVDPNEVEEVILSHKGILEVLVYSKSNSVIGNVVCADVVRSDPSVTVPQIIQRLRTRLQEFKIPRVVNFVDSIERTRTGKKSRR